MRLSAPLAAQFPARLCQTRRDVVARDAQERAPIVLGSNGRRSKWGTKAGALLSCESRRAWWLTDMEEALTPAVHVGRAVQQSMDCTVLSLHLACPTSVPRPRAMLPAP